VACKAENDVPLGVYRTWVKEVEKGTYPKVRRHFTPILCNQCEKPACTTVCPVIATYTLPNGIVYIDPHRCIGCGYCMAACPYAVRFIHPTRHVAEKCDWCWPRVREGYGPPACVQSCPTGVMVFGDLDDPESEQKSIAWLRHHLVLCHWSPIPGP
jgi:tetrathionate reductase subunit B